MKRHAEILKRTAAALAAAATLAFSGCAVTGTSSTTSAVSGASISGTVHGGQQPVSGAKVYLFAVSTNGYGSNATSILSNPGYVTTTSGGGFNITGDYTCPSNSQVYLAALGGNPGLTAGTNNGQLTLLAGLGACSSLTSATNVTINEVSTAAMVYTMSSFMSNYVQASTSSTNTVGVARAMANIPNLINVASGTVLNTTPGGNGTVPAAEINTLADVIAPCVNSNGNDGNCSSLFSATSISGTTAPDTVNALLSIAQNPARNVSTIYALSSANAPFQPTLATAPNDWTMAINYSGSTLSRPYGLTIDIAGNVWVSNSGNNTVSQFNLLGVPQSPTYSGGGLSTPMGVSSDLVGNIFVANMGSSTVTRISNAGIQTSLTGGGLNQPVDVAVDGNNSIYVANQGAASISQFYSNGTASNGNGYTGGGVNVPTSIAVNSDGLIWTANSGNSSLSKFAPSAGTYQSPSTGYTGGGLLNPNGLAFDSSSNVIVSNASTTVSRFQSGGTAVTNSPYSGGGTGTQGGIAVDGDGSFFVAETGSNAIKVLLNSGTAKSSSTGFQGGGLNGPTRLTIDSSGDVWVTNNGTGSTSLTEFIGLAAPTVAPLATAVANGKLGIRP